MKAKAGALMRHSDGTDQVSLPEIPPRSEWKGVLWMNNPLSPWREDSEEAKQLLGNAGFVVISIETSGISGPEYILVGQS